MHKFWSLVLAIIALGVVGANTVQAASSTSYVSVVNPVRGSDFASSNQDLSVVVKNQQQALNQANVPATWLLRYDVLKNPGLLNNFKNLNANQETGLFLEITPSWTADAGVTYRQSAVWHNAGSIFLTGYEVAERTKLIDQAFGQYKQIFGQFPTAVGAWWIDAGSLSYMQQKYGVKAALIVADQYSTDNYQIWGQYFGYPYYPMKRNALYPAQNSGDKIPVVMMQWAARDPVNGYGKGVEESTYSVQANDYLDYHQLDINYFNALVDVYTKQPNNQLNQIVVGLENSYDWNKYGPEYLRQIQSLVKKQASGQLTLASMSQFGQIYQSTFPDVSPSQVIVANDPLGSSKKAVWWMDPYYRAAWFADNQGARLADLRQYVEGQTELCLEKPCQSINFATETTRVLDVVTNGMQWVLSDGKISDFKFGKVGDKGVLSYLNQAGRQQVVEFLPRDIGVDGKIYSIDGAILNAKQQAQQYTSAIQQKLGGQLGLESNEVGRLVKVMLSFLVLVVIGLWVPGEVLRRRIARIEISRPATIFLSLMIGLVSLTGVGMIGWWLNRQWLGWVWVGGMCGIWGWSWQYRQLRFRIDWSDRWLKLILIAGVAFQLIPVWRNGLVYGYGLGFWGPNGHDGIWHLALAKQLSQGMPPDNPIFAGDRLVNYHYLYDLLVAVMHYLSWIPVEDLVFRCLPLLFSVLLGLGTWGILKLSHQINRWMIGWAMLMVYFAGSFGWVVSIIKHQEWGGESAFWANQAISFNLNPPFAISLLLVLAIGLLLAIESRRANWWSFGVLAVMIGMIVGFKAYAAVLVVAALGVIAVIRLVKDHQWRYILLGGLSGVIALAVIGLTFGFNQAVGVAGSTFVWSPGWFIQTMIDFDDRVGWTKLAAARSAYYQRQEWWKFGLVELISLIIFIVGNLGLRILAVGGVRWLGQLRRSVIGQYGLIISGVGLVIPLLFIQRGTAWNTIQFSYYTLYFAAVGAGVVVGSWWGGSAQRRVVVGLSYLIILGVMPISSITTAKGYFYAPPHAYVSTEEMAGLNFLARQPRGVVLSLPYDASLRQQLGQPYPLVAYDSTAYVSAISGQPSYLADAAQNEILGTDYNQRLVAEKDFLNKKANGQFLDQNRIKYLYLTRINNRAEGLDETALGLTKIYENPSVLIYSHP